MVYYLLPLVNGLDSTLCGENINFFFVHDFIAHLKGENYKQPLHNQFLAQLFIFLPIFPAKSHLYQIFSLDPSLIQSYIGEFQLPASN